MGQAKIGTEIEKPNIKLKILSRAAENDRALAGDLG
jgi:hypothetical protein